MTQKPSKQHKSIPKTFKLLEKYTGKYLCDTGDKEGFVKAGNTEKMMEKMKNYDSLKDILK